MKLIAWNCRGMGRGAAVRFLRSLVRSQRPDLLFLCETKIKAPILQVKLLRLGFPSLCQVPLVGTKGGLVVAWKESVEVEPINLGRFQITCLVYSDPPHQPWMLSCIHGPSSWANKPGFWHNLQVIGNSFAGPWMLMGDFNAILSQQDKRGGRPFASSSTDPFFSFVHSFGLVDLGYEGNPFTWNNKRAGAANIKERLDRSFANQCWVHLFPNAQVTHLPATVSDHNPVILSTKGNYDHLPKPFKFEAFWTRDPSSHQVVAEVWAFVARGMGFCRQRLCCFCYL